MSEYDIPEMRMPSGRALIVLAIILCVAVPALTVTLIILFP
jgi:hypothetical protein